MKNKKIIILLIMMLLSVVTFLSGCTTPEKTEHAGLNPAFLTPIPPNVLTLGIIIILLIMMLLSVVTFLSGCTTPEKTEFLCGKVTYLSNKNEIIAIDDVYYSVYGIEDGGIAKLNYAYTYNCTISMVIKSFIKRGNYNEIRNYFSDINLLECKET